MGFLEDLVSSKSNSVQRENVVSKIQKHISDLVDDSEEEEFVEEEIVENVFLVTISIYYQSMNVFFLLIIKLI